MKKLWYILLVCFSLNCWARDNLTDVIWTPHMVWAMSEAATQAAPYGLTITEQAIIYKESTACKHKVGRNEDSKAVSYGCGQLTYKTANMIWQSSNGIGGVGDSAVQPVSTSTLLHNDKLNIHISAEYLQYCNWVFESLYGKPNLHRAIVCYNKGEHAATKMTDKQIESDDYLISVLNYIRQIQQLPVDYD